jgi:hypothetical protein
MRLGRLIFEAVLLLGFLVASLLLYIEWTRDRSPFLPHFVFIHDKGSLVVQGTWRREDGDDAWPSQTTTVECERTSRQCTEASAVLASEDYLMPVKLSTFQISEWNDSVVIARGSTAQCIEETYEFHLATKSVTGLVSRKRTQLCDGMPGAAEARSPVRLRMVDGYRASRQARAIGRSR